MHKHWSLSLWFMAAILLWKLLQQFASFHNLILMTHERTLTSFGSLWKKWRTNVSKNGKKVLRPIIVCNNGYWISSQTIRVCRIFKKQVFEITSPCTDVLFTLYIVQVLSDYKPKNLVSVDTSSNLQWIFSFSITHYKLRTLFQRSCDGF